MQATINKITQSTHINARGKAETTFHVSFNVGDHGPFSESFTKPDFNEQTVREKLKGVADTILQIHTPSQP